MDDVIPAERPEFPDGYPEECKPEGDFLEVPTTPKDLPRVPLTTQERLGQALFFDKYLSSPPGQSCADCHTLASGWTGPNGFLNAGGSVYEGARKKRYGNRKPPSSAYATEAPVLHLDDFEKIFIGGNFWDGRATGKELGNPAADQAQGPFLNPVEQNNSSEQEVCFRILNSNYAFEQTGFTYPQLFRAVYGPGALDCFGKVERTYNLIAISIAAWEDSCQSNQYSSKYDAYQLGWAELTEQEKWGLELFEGKAMCANCHPSEPRPDGMPALFTDFTYDNLGVPRNPCNPWYYMPEKFNPIGLLWTDLGIGFTLATIDKFLPYLPSELGKVKVPTLRNVDKQPVREFTKAYMHNGFFKTLYGVVHFYNTRDTLPRCEDIPGIPDFITEEVALANDCWPEAEVPLNVNEEELGDLGLTFAEEMALVAFMKTLSDGAIQPQCWLKDDLFEDGAFNESLFEGLDMPHQ